MEYTKGKWSVNKDYPKQGDRVIIATRENGGVKSICKLTLQHLPEETDANAQLICEAVNACVKLNPDNPVAVAQSISDMYEALKEICSQLSLECSVDYLYKHNLSLPLSKGKAALAKAEGK